jgi:glycosyltransferase involved in cell wall biosynthesis
VSVSRSRWLLLEAYYGGSHARLIHGLLAHLGGEFDFETLTLPARKWKWRMRGSALHFAEELAQRDASEYRGVFVGSMCNAAELRGLVDPAWSTRPWVVYFHENQLRYPVAHFDRRDHHFAWTNAVSALAADRLLFNSRYNLESMCEDLRAVIAKMPDARPENLVASLRERGQVLQVPIEDVSVTPLTRRGACHIVWNHRWEFDKGPEALLRACQVASEFDPREVAVSVVGQSFRERPAAFDRIGDLLGPRLRHFGEIEPRQEYLEMLAGADVVLSTAEHEFQGLAVLEGALHGAVPLVPDDLAYRETWPEAWRYRREDLAEALRDRIANRQRWRREDPGAVAAKFSWSALRERWAELFRAAEARKR